MATKQSHAYLPKHGSHPLFFLSIHQVLGSRHTQRKHSSYFEGAHSLMLLRLFNLYAEYIMRNAGLDEAQAGIKIAGRNINYLRYTRHHPYGRKQRRTKESLDESERGE